MRAIESWDEAYVTESDAYQLQQDAGMPGIGLDAATYRREESAKLYALVDAWNKAHEPEPEEAEQIADWLYSAAEGQDNAEWWAALDWASNAIRGGDYKA